MARTYTTDAVVLRSLRLGEADRIVHLYTRERGRIGAVAKGIRKTKSRFGGRLEPLSHVTLQLHQGSGELQTVTGVDLVRAHSTVREDFYRLGVGLIGAEAMLRLFPEQEQNERAFTALTRFLDALEEAGTGAGRPALDPLVLAFQLKLLWLSGYLPHLTSCAECGADDVPLVGYSPQAAHADRGRSRSHPEESRASSCCSESLLRRPGAWHSTTGARAKRSGSSQRRTSTTAASGCGR